MVLSTLETQPESTEMDCLYVGMSAIFVVLVSGTLWYEGSIIFRLKSDEFLGVMVTTSVTSLSLATPQEFVCDSLLSMLRSTWQIILSCSHAS